MPASDGTRGTGCVVVVVVDVLVEVVVLVEVLVDVVLVGVVVVLVVVLVEVVAAGVVLVDTTAPPVVDGAADGAVTASSPSLHAASRIDAIASRARCARRRGVTSP